MFERYTEKARRVIFFARYEASQYGSPYIESEHLLLGILREDKAMANRFLRNHASVESIRNQVEGHTVFHEKISTSVDLPLSNECKRVLAYAAEEAERLAHKHIGTEHLLLGLLREDKSFAAQILTERGVEIAQVRSEMAVSEEELSRRPAPIPRPPTPVIPIRFVDAQTSETLFANPNESPGRRLPAIGETVTFSQPDAPARTFRVEDVTWVYTLEKAENAAQSGAPHLHEIVIAIGKSTQR
jgi:ATP-dependent Clp protease ATP-binding subunit ClpA